MSVTVTKTTQYTVIGPDKLTVQKAVMYIVYDPSTIGPTATPRRRQLINC